MCGRFVSASPPDEIARYFDATPPPLEQVVAPSFNVAPTDDVYIVLEHDGARMVEAVHWGLVPVWARDPKVGSRMINARAESVAVKNAFKPALLARRCIVPADGFFEWQARVGSKKKQPMYIRRTDEQPLAFAGLWEVWRDRDAPDQALHSCTIITTTANATMAPIHDRMPVILPSDVWATWLDEDVHGVGDLDRLSALLVPAADDLLHVHPVSADVGNVRNNAPELIARVEPTPADHIPGVEPAPAEIHEQGTLL